MSAKDVWMNPTATSPACRFEMTRAGKKFLSACGIWETPYVASRALPVNPKTTRPDLVELCPFCRDGRRVDAHTGFGRAPKGPRKGRSWRQSVLPSVSF